MMILDSGLLFLGPPCMSSYIDKTHCCCCCCCCSGVIADILLMVAVYTMQCSGLSDETGKHLWRLLSDSDDLDTFQYSYFITTIITIIKYSVRKFVFWHDIFALFNSN